MVILSSSQGKLEVTEAKLTRCGKSLTYLRGDTSTRHLESTKVTEHITVSKVRFSSERLLKGAERISETLSRV